MATFDQLHILQRWAVHTFRYTDLSFRRILNEQTGGTIVSVTQDTPGSYFEDVYWGNDPDAVVLDDPGDNAPVSSPSELKQIKIRDIKVAARSNMYEWQSIAQRWMRASPQAIAQVWGRTIAESMLKVRVRAAMNALVACFSTGLHTNGLVSTTANQGDDEFKKLIADEGTAKMDLAKLIAARGKFGDLYGEITGVIMHSGAFFGMQAQNLATYQRLFMYGNNFVTRTSDGMPIFVTDNPILTFTQGTTVKYRTLLLRPMAAVIRDHTDFEALIDRQSGTKWINTRAQAQQTFSIYIKGNTWKAAAIHPVFAASRGTAANLIGVGSTAGALDTPGSWQRGGVAEGKPLLAKEMPGVMLITQ